MFRTFFFLLTSACCLLPSAVAEGSWKIVSAETMSAPADGVAHHVLTLNRPRNATGEDGATEATLHFVSFEAGRHTFRVFDQNAHDNASLADVMAENHCIAGTNGGYFTAEFDPVGLLICNGRTIRAEQHARLLSGVFEVTGTGHISLRRTSETSSTSVKHARQAVQCGPFLVEDRKQIGGLNTSRSARRTGVYSDGGGRWGLVVSSPLTLEEFAAVLADPALLPGGLKIARALNLDGGGSTALWLRAAAGGEPISLPERGYVRDFIGIVPRVRATAR